jgi:AraC-like DNA-binding protein
MNFIHISSIAELHQFIGGSKPLHPLITIIREWPEMDFDFTGVKMTGDLYIIGFKGANGSIGYGRNSYDFQEGTMVYISPNQVLSFDETEKDQGKGWTIFFHPDLIRNSELGNSIQKFDFFNYTLSESLHISEKEKQIINGFVDFIEAELQQNIDKHSQNLIVANLYSLLKYSHRFYDRQFNTRTNLNKDVIIRFEQFLKAHFEEENSSEKHIPTVVDCGKAMNMSPKYLSDLLRSETGRSAKDHIHDYMIEKAKNMLLGSSKSVSEIAYYLGFEYPQHFSKLFKSKTGYNPTVFRNLN